MEKQILVRPVITEKAEKLSSKRNVYTFIVHKDANKIEVKKSIEAMYKVSVKAVNTALMPGKSKQRNTKTAVVKGRKPSYKKALITLAPGDQINIFGDETK
ncbi:MAG: 50S ribosomal protein L23 [Bacteroidota bacterium]|nr:50S ribosomal protein L23 [Bacteroidota bacterium]